MVLQTLMQKSMLRVVPIVIKYSLKTLTAIQHLMYYNGVTHLEFYSSSIIQINVIG